MHGCMCATGFVGPTCNVKAATTQPLDPTMSLSFSLDTTNANLVHFRLDSTVSRWVSLMIINDADYLKGDSMSAFTDANNNWVLEDQYGHPNSPQMSDALVNGQQNQMNAIAWASNGGMSAQWSRLLNTGDTAGDMAIQNGVLS